MRRDAEGVLEGSREVRLGDAADARQPKDRPFLVRGGIHPVLCAQQTAQQFRVVPGCHERTIVTNTIPRWRHPSDSRAKATAQAGIPPTDTT